jgi:hypothetical protein
MGVLLQPRERPNSGGGAKLSPGVTAPYVSDASTIRSRPIRYIEKILLLY